MASLKLFENKKVRSAWNDIEKAWYFSVQDVVVILTESLDVKQYIKKMLSRDDQLKTNWGTICTQSIPSPRAEPFKLWLAKVGSERLDEIENPELAMQRTRNLATFHHKKEIT